jgi:hypothetical protein
MRGCIPGNLAIGAPESQTQEPADPVVQVILEALAHQQRVVADRAGGADSADFAICRHSV